MIEVVRENSLPEDDETEQWLELYHNKAGQLVCVHNGRRLPVKVVRLFPWTHPQGYFSLRTQAGREIALLESLANLDEKSAEALQREINESGFFFEVIEILEQREEFELLYWRVLTKQGERIFQTRLEDFPREIAPGRSLVQDLCGDWYQI